MINGVLLASPTGNDWQWLAVLTQWIVILAAARAGAYLLGKLGQPSVVGEMVAGLVLGPSALGALWPQWSAWVFPPENQPLFHALGELGLLLLLFVVGVEFHFEYLHRLAPSAVRVSLAGIAVPFAFGLALGWWLHPRFAPEVPRGAFCLFLAVALSITAMPVLSRIMLHFRLAETPLGVLTITAAAVDDALGWILLASVSSLVQGQFRLLDVAQRALGSLAFVALVVLLVRPLLSGYLDRALARHQGALSSGDLGLLAVCILSAGWVTEWIGIFSVFGPFVLGASLSHLTELRRATRQQVGQLVFAVLLPVFFVSTGLRTEVGTLASGSDWFCCAAVFLLAVAGKTLGCGLAAKLGGQFTWREVGCVAALMNTRGLMELVVINLGRELGVIPPPVFTMLVLMALGTTLMTSPLVAWLAPRPRGSAVLESAADRA